MASIKFWHAVHYQGVGWGLTSSRDDEFLMQSIDKIKSLQQPFFAHLITLQSHGPFKNYRKKTLDNIDLSHFNGHKKNYLATIYEVDQALEQFFEGMEGEGLLQNTIVFLYSDHHPGNLGFGKTVPR